MSQDVEIHEGNFHFIIGFDAKNMIPLFEKDSGLPYSVEELWADMETYGYLQSIKERAANIIKFEMINIPARMKSSKQGPWA